MGPRRAVCARDNIVFLGNGGYLEIVDFIDPAHPNELAKILTPSFIDNIAVQGNLAFVAIQIGAFLVFDITNLNALVELHPAIDNFKAPAFIADEKYVYAASTKGFLRIFDFTDPSHPQQVGSFQKSPEERG